MTSHDLTPPTSDKLWTVHMSRACRDVGCVLHCGASWGDPVMSQSQAGDCKVRQSGHWRQQNRFLLSNRETTEDFPTGSIMHCNSVFSTNVKLLTLSASLLMKHHVLSPTCRPLVSVFLYFVFLFYFLLYLNPLQAKKPLCLPYPTAILPLDWLSFGFLY